MRLAGGPDSHSGRVELYLEGDWVSVCREDWGASEAAVVCRQLGFSGVQSSDDGVTEYNRGKGIIMDKLDCEGRESNVQDCEWGSLFGKFRCGYANHAGITCQTGTSDITI